MPRLELHRYVLTALIFALWLIPPGIAWLLPSQFFAATFPVWGAGLDVTDIPWREVNALILGAGLMVPLLLSPAPVGSLTAGAASTGQRGEAGGIDIAVVVLVFGRPLEALIVALNSGAGGLDAWLAVPPSIWDSLWGVPGWLVYTAGHLMLRRRTLGQAVAGYRLIHPTPLGGWQEALYQTGRVLIYGVFDVLDPRHRYRQRMYLTLEQTYAEEARERRPPRWYASAGVTTQVVPRQR
tara:strand:+ start:43442 stop:44158 length:717 start_codon:yes stop_codon:yes gene_type:complete